MKLNEILHKALEADGDERKVLYDFYLNSLNNILEAKAILESKENEIRDKIAKYSATIVQTDTIKVEQKDIFNNPIGDALYPFSGSWAERIDYVLSKKSNLTAREVSNEIERIQPELKGKTISSVSPTLSDNIAKDKRYNKIVDEKLRVNRFTLKQ